MIFANHASCAVATPDSEVVQIGEAVGQRAQRRGLVQGAVRPVRIVKVLVLARSMIIRSRWFQIKVRSSSSRRQLPIRRSMFEFIRGARIAERTPPAPTAWKATSNAAVKKSSARMACAWDPRNSARHGAVPGRSRRPARPPAAHDVAVPARDGPARRMPDRALRDLRPDVTGFRHPQVVGTAPPWRSRPSPPH